MRFFFFALRRDYVWRSESEERVFSVYIPAALNDTPKESRGLNDLRVWISVIWSVFASDGASVGVRVFVHTTHTHVMVVHSRIHTQANEFKILCTCCSA